MTGAVLLRGGHVVDGDGTEPVRTDVSVTDGVVTAVGEAITAPGAVVIDCTDRLVLPGFTDTHSHADAAVFDEEVQLALLRQGVTTIIAGQDGVSYAPGDGGYATGYFGALNGAHPGYEGGGVAGLLAGYDGTTPINVAYLVPAGTVRFEVMGRGDRPATDAELSAMTGLVATGLAEGAVGLSSGLDYVPGMFADTAELATLAGPLRDGGGVYVTHMRGGYETNIRSGVREVMAIVRGAGGVAAHLSHYHGPSELALAALAEAERAGCDLTFDAYPYRAGCTLLAMPLLPPDLLALDPAETARRLTEPDVRAALLRDWLPRVAAAPSMGEGWPNRLTLANISAPGYEWATGLTLAEAAARSSATAPSSAAPSPGTGHSSAAGHSPEAAGRSATTTAEEFALDLLTVARLEVSAVMPLPPGRTVDELAVLVRHHDHMGGSDGIYLGAHPHPRGWGTMARLLGRHVRARRDLSWGQAARHLARHPAERFGLGARGRVAPGFAADLVVVDPAAVEDAASYAEPRRPAVGIDDVLVAGLPVLCDGRLTGEPAGTGLRRSP